MTEGVGMATIPTLKSLVFQESQGLPPHRSKAVASATARWDRFASMAKMSAGISERLNRLPPYMFGRLNAQKLAMRRRGIDVIDLGMGNPPDPTPELVVEKLREAVLDPRNHRYSVSAGLDNLRLELARLYRRYWGVKLDPDSEIVACIGSKEGFSHACIALLDPGDTVLVPTPAFPIHIYGPALAGANVLRLPMGTETAFLRQLDDVSRHLYPRPKVLILNYPHNPTARVISEDFFKEVVAIARRTGLMVIHDFAYGVTTFDGYKAPSFMQARGAKSVGIEFFTLSKGWNMAGWRIGFAVGNREMIAALTQVKGYYDYGIFAPVQIAAIMAMRHCDDEVAKQAMRYQRRRDCLMRGLRRIGWKPKKPKATMFAWVRIPERYRKMGSMDFAMLLLEKAQVATAPGAGFGIEGEGYLRMALVENEQRLNQAVRQIDRALRM